MRTSTLCLGLVACVLLAGCSTTRSISDSGYRAEPQPHYRGVRCAPKKMPAEFGYRGELSEMDVLGIAPGKPISDEAIREALERSGKVTLRKGSTILLVQSGAVFPDDAMAGELKRDFRVVPFSGVPQANAGTNAPGGYSRMLRMAAAQAGAEAIVCYWGILESETENMATKTISWVPVMNWLVPDERQRMRVRLKVAVVDVRSGDWIVLLPDAFDDVTRSTSPARARVDQRQVEFLKQQAYEAAARELAQL
jgi:hypothetical protein